MTPFRTRPAGSPLPQNNESPAGAVRLGVFEPNQQVGAISPALRPPTAAGHRATSEVQAPSIWVLARNNKDVTHNAGLLTHILA